MTDPTPPSAPSTGVDTRVGTDVGDTTTSQFPPETPEQTWGVIVQKLTDDPRITPQLHGFIGLAQARGVMAGTLYLEVPNDLTRDMFEQRIRIPLLQALGMVDGQEIDNFAIVVNPSVSAPPPRVEAAVYTPPRVVHEATPVTPAGPRGGETRSSEAQSTNSVQDADTRINPKYSFDNFVIGGSNRFAHAAAVAVAEAPAKAYNPLFIYGDSGLGKTHLLHAIGSYARSLFSGIKVRYVSSEEFTNDYINSLRDNRISDFQTRYREVDVLLIDDIQFLQGKIETQETFFHTFNTLHEHNKQVVITSDLPPKQLTGFEDRMRSRFEWGLITDVQTPDLETRIAILRKKAQSEQLQVPDEILEYIASKVTSNIRELEGTLIRVTAYANLNRSAVDLQLVQTVLKDLITLDEDNVIAPVDIINHTAEYFRLDVDELYGSSRSQAVATARQIAMYLCRELTNLSLPKIGQLFGGRDHTTVMYANKKISELMKERRSIYNQVTELSSRIKQTHRYSKL